MFKTKNKKESERKIMKNKTKITSHSDTLENCIKRHILDQESCRLQRDMYDLFQSVFLKKKYFVMLSQSQTTKINNTIKKHLQTYLKRIQKVRVS